MTAARRPLRGPARALARLALALLLGACGGSGASGQARPTGTSTLVVTVAGLPADGAADLSIGWPSGHETRLRDGATLAQLPAGRYRLRGGAVTAGGAAWYPSLTEGEVELADGQSTTAAVTYAPSPITGAWVRELAAVDAAMVGYMTARRVPAGVVGITRGGQLVHWRGYGWQDEARTVPMGPDGMFRLASLSKPLTWRLVAALVEAGLLAPEAPAYPLLGLDPLPGATVDPRIGEITVQHLLDHRSGWDYQQGRSRDYASANREVSQAMGIPGPASKLDLARFMMGQPLQHDPGAVASYNNFNYVLLGLVAERVTGLSYLDALHALVLDPAGAAEVEVGRTARGLQGPREPFYADPDTGCSVFDAARCAFLPLAYGGGVYLEAVDAAGGLVGSTRSLLRFLDAYFIMGPPATPGSAWDAIFYGSYPGTSTMLRQRPDGVNLVVLVDQRRDPSGLSYELAPAFDEVIHGITEWPAGGPP